MRCKKQNVRLTFICIVVCVLLVSSNYAYGQEGECEKVSMLVRPFAVNPENKFMRFDGIFNTGTVEHIIGVFLKNVTKDTIRNVTASASFKPGSGVRINLVEDTYNFENLEPNIPVLGLFRANFEKDSSGKPTLILHLKGDNSFECKVERKLFVISSKPDWKSDRIYTVSLPEGRITTEITEFVGGDNLKSSTMPMKFKLSVDHVNAFEGKFSKLPFSDPWWTTVGIIGPEGGGPTVIDKNTTELYGTGCGNILISTADAVYKSGMAALISQKGDFIRIGQDNTPPGPGEFTKKEKVVVSVKYLGPPVVGEPYDAYVTWTYMRITNKNTYTHIVKKEKVSNRHFAENPGVEMIPPNPIPGQEFKLITEPLSHGRTNNDAYVVAILYKASDTQLKDVVDSIVLRDDGHGGDETAEDGRYTGMGTFPPLPPPEGTYPALPPPDETLKASIFEFGGNNTPPGADALTAAGKIGGILNSAPPFKLLFPVKREKEKETREKSESTKTAKESIKTSIPGAGIPGRALRRILSIFRIDHITLNVWGAPKIHVTGISAEDASKAMGIKGTFEGGIKLSLGPEFKGFPNSKPLFLGVSFGYSFDLESNLAFRGGDSSKLKVSAHAIHPEFVFLIPVGNKLFFRVTTGFDFFRQKIKDTTEESNELKNWVKGKHLSLETGLSLVQSKRFGMTLNAGYFLAKLKNLEKTAITLTEMVREIPQNINVEESIKNALNKYHGGLNLSFNFEFRLK